MTAPLFSWVAGRDTRAAETIAQAVGVDIAKDSLNVHLHPAGMGRRFANNPKGCRPDRLAPRRRIVRARSSTLGTFEHKCAASLAGLAPITRDSGRHRGRRFIGGGRAALRQALSMPALVAVRFNADLKAKYEALRDTGKPPKVALTAIMRKLLILANALLRDGRTSTPSPARPRRIL